jgi:hypothetical protein
MTAARPPGDAITIYMVIEVLKCRPGGTLEAAYNEVHKRLRPHRFRRRAKSKNLWIGVDEAMAVGDKLSESHVRSLYRKGRDLIAADHVLAEEMKPHLGDLKSEFLASLPDAYLLPVRNRGEMAELMPWMIALCRPKKPKGEERVTFFFPHDPPPGVQLVIQDAEELPA